MSMMSQAVLDAATERTASGVSWGAVFAGAFGAAALSLVLIVLGIGLGVSTLSPWPHHGLGASALGASSIAWLVFTQVIASAAGGYLAGRLRIKWTTVHTDEVYFRDTAHGFLAWAVAALAVAALVGSVLGNAVSSGASAGAALVADVGAAAPAVASGIAGHNAPMSSSAQWDGHDATSKYLVDSLFRPEPSSPEVPAETNAAARAEAGRIVVNSIHSASLPQQDRQYLAQLVARRTGLSVADADKRVGDTFALVHDTVANAEQAAREAADKARKAAAYSALWMFVSLLCGAFFASLSATIGGKQRDRVTHIAAI